MADQATDPRPSDISPATKRFPGADGRWQVMPPHSEILEIASCKGQGVRGHKIDIAFGNSKSLFELRQFLYFNVPPAQPRSDCHFIDADVDVSLAQHVQSCSMSPLGPIPLLTRPRPINV